VLSVNCDVSLLVVVVDEVVVVVVVVSGSPVQTTKYIVSINQSIISLDQAHGP